MSNSEHLFAIVISTIAPVKLRPNSESPLADELLYGMVVEILNKESDGWYYIKTHYGYYGYVNEIHLLVDNNKAMEWKEKANGFIMHSIVDVLSAPEYESCSLATLTRGAMVQILESENDKWAKIHLLENKIGWIRKSFIKKIVKVSPPKNEEEFRKSLVNTALLYLGTQYRWGGKSPMGIDCSGLCSMAYLLNGIIIYRDAVLKEEYMRKIGREEMKPGDLLFFPGHVAMYIGNDRFVHSTGKEGMVIINSLNPLHSDYREELDKNLIAVGTIF